ncbi:MupA/Atu3671 family FMN-dependent luciferase-like monooxygenase [Saccharothrix syringae]|uniref:LLM class flavin-dependent oxidoreductase n=1 Tax=Saccharothrix syringae TaxID=103733 RepID=A0A5Q0H443_SACSY|nr:MupA/Atu3671 family FMN-dependent luciferase-like monooxygenase [Saccharothrix syringae]QFZ20988.1 LLM class flavin-dependent oxidoreductase [Saccharothrix syringae]
MDFSLFYFSNDDERPGRGRYELLLEGARFADTHGFRAVWTPERHFHEFGGIYPNPAVAGAAVAAVTERVGIRAGSVVAPLHHPFRIAEEWAVVDNLSDGRVGLSFASGWHAVDFSLRPENYANRKDVLFDQLDAVRALWRGEPAGTRDGAGNEVRVTVHPRPVQAELPVWVTSGGDVETFRRAGRAGAGLLTHLLGQEVDALAGRIAEYRKAVAGRADGWPGHVVLMVHTFLGADDAEVKEQVRAPLTAYLRSSLGLITSSGHAGMRKLGQSSLREKDVEFLVRRSFDRYYDDGGLLGAVDKCRGVVERLRAIGVDEIACLIDFGLPAEQVLGALPRLDALRALSAGVAA